MSDEKRRILELLAQGKITVDQADELMRAVDSRRTDAAPASTGEPSPPRWVRIQVQKQAKEGRDPNEVNIRVPAEVLVGLPERARRWLRHNPVFETKAEAARQEESYRAFAY